MGWQRDVNMDQVVVAVAPYGGLIAITRDRSKIVKIHGSGTVISIYSGSGRHIASIKV